MTKKYIPNMIRTRKMREGILLVADQGGWTYLTKESYKKFLRHELDEKLEKILEETGIILTEENIKKVMETTLSKKKFLDYPTGLHIVLPTLRCNHQCIYCHSASRIGKEGEYDMTIETARKTVDFIFSTKAKSLKIEYQGGDALLNKKALKEFFYYGTKKAKETGKKVKFSLVTNTTLLDQEMINWIKENKIGLTTSLDGPKEVHDKNRQYIGGAGTYDDVVKNIKRCKEQGINIGALMVTTRHSLTKAKEIIDEYIRLGFRSIQLKYIDKIGFAEEQWKEAGYTAEEYLKFWKEAMEYIIQKNKEGTRIIERITQIFLRKIITPKDPGFLDLRNPCGIALGQIAYNYNGDIYSCDEGRGFDIFKLGNVYKTTFEEYSKSKQTQALVEASILETQYCDTCVYKPYCGQCPVLNYAEQRNLIPKLAKSNRCKVLKAQFDWIFDKLIFDKEARNILTSWV